MKEAPIYQFNGHGPEYAHRYSHNIEYRAPMGFKPYFYRWHHLPTGKIGATEVFCRNRDDMQKLVATWSNDVWRYTCGG